MKNILVMFCMLLLTFVSFGSVPGDEKTYYYFYLSESKIPNNNYIKETILYTEIMTVTISAAAEEKFFTEKVTEWARKINSMCENRDGCSSDVNFYPTYKSADEHQKRIYQRYKDPDKYIMKQVKF